MPSQTASAALAIAPVLAAAPALAGLVQETSGHTTGTSLTLTFANPVAAGHAVIVCVAGYYDGTVTGMTLGTSGGSFGHYAGAGGSGGNNAGIYANLSAAQSSATLTITTSAAGILAWAYEVAGNVCFDVAKGGTGTGTSWSSGATAATVPYPHFVVGLGSVIANSGSISSTGSGWTNESPVTNVVGAGSHAIGAVSGYRQPASGGTYTYSGTSSASSAWGAVTAAFVVLPASGASPYETGWGGYVFSEHASYTGITATFTVPAVSGGAYDSIWVGLGNVYQAGIYQTYASGQPGNSSTRPWTFWIAGAGENWNAAAFPAAAGDSLTLTIELTSTDWLMTIANNTQDWTYTEAKSVLAVNIGSVEGNGAGPAFWPYPVRTAEVIIERETVELPDYGTLAFTAIATTPAATTAPSPLLTVNAAVDQYPGAFDLGAGSFTMTWNAYS